MNFRKLAKAKSEKNQYKFFKIFINKKSWYSVKKYCRQKLKIKINLQ